MRQRGNPVHTAQPTDWPHWQRGAAPDETEHYQSAFLVPPAGPTPVDSEAATLVRVLYEHGPVAGDIKLGYAYVATAGGLYAYIQSVESVSADLALYFGRTPYAAQPSAPESLAVTTVLYHRRLLHMRASGGGLVYIVYVGENWERDRDAFLTRTHSLARVRGQRRIGVCYVGRHDPPITPPAISASRRQTAMLLVADANRGLGYSPQGTEPLSIEANSVLSDCAAALRTFTGDLRTQGVAQVHTLPDAPDMSRSHAAAPPLTALRSGIEVHTLPLPWSGEITRERLNSIAWTLYTLLRRAPYQSMRIQPAATGADSKLPVADDATVELVTWSDGQDTIRISDSAGTWCIGIEDQTVIALSDSEIWVERPSDDGTVEGILFSLRANRRLDSSA